MKRGQLWWVDFDPTRGSEIKKRRPTVILSVNGLNQARRTVVVVPLSNGPPPRPPVVVSTPSAGAGSVAVCDQLRAVDKARLTESRGALSTDDLRAVEEGVRSVLGV